jgi:hypothetical protein
MVAIFKLFVLRAKTKYEYNCVLASSAIVDSIDGLPNPKLLNKFNVNAPSSFHGCAAACHQKKDNSN